MFCSSTLHHTLDGFSPLFPHLARARAGPCRSGTRGTSCLLELERRARRAQLVMRKSAKKGRESLGECFAFRLPPSSLSPSEERELSKVSDGEDEKKKKKATSRLLSSCSSSSICQRAAQSSPPALLRSRAPGDKGNQQRVRAASPPTSRRSSFVAAQNRPHQNSNPLSRFLS